MKQADGTELAKQINIFPAELRGIGEAATSLKLLRQPTAEQSPCVVTGDTSTPITNRYAT